MVTKKNNIKKKTTKKKTVKKKVVKKKAPIKKKVVKKKAPIKKKTSTKKKATPKKTKKPATKQVKPKTSVKNTVPKTKTKSKAKTKKKKLRVKLAPEVLKIRERLIRKRSELMKLIRSSQSVEREAADLTFSNEIDLASSLEGREMTFQLSSRDRNELKLDYGKCETCEKKISMKRLQIMPLTALCIECQETSERF